MTPKKKARSWKGWAVVNQGKIGNASYFRHQKPPMQVYSNENKPDIKDYYAPDTAIVRVQITEVSKRRRKKG